MEFLLFFVYIGVFLGGVVFFVGFGCVWLFGFLNHSNNESLLQPRPYCGFKMGTCYLALRPREYIISDNIIAGTHPIREVAAFQC